MVEIPTRQVHVYSLDLVDYRYPELKIRTHVSSGTYVRTLAQDIGETLGTGAYCRELRRTKIASRTLAEATTLESLGITS
jgi:tRNA pseudouridine55 synthase